MPASPQVAPGRDPEQDRNVQVAVPLPLFREFTYRVPDRMETPPAAGTRVLVPFGHRKLVGIVVSGSPRVTGLELKNLERVLDRDPILSPQLLSLGQWVARYYFSPLGEVLQSMLPPGLLSKPSSTVSRSWPVKTRMAIRSVDLSRESGLTRRQRELLALLRARKLPVAVSRFVREAGTTRGTLKAMAARGAVVLKPERVYRSPWLDSDPPPPVKRHSLNPDQSRILEEIRRRLSGGGFHSMLIHGITGSGKTEVYLNAISQVVRTGGSALMLVPEIGLTPQISNQFRGWFGSEVAILHSALSEGERFDQWLRIREGKARVVIGTRSSVFAPVPDLRIAIVDEEHDSSYKQGEMPRYHARDAALKRGQLEQALVVLGSATPQLEIYHVSRDRGRPRPEVLPRRVLDRSLPQVEVVDMRLEFQKHGKALILSDLLRDSLRQSLECGDQALLLLNRRGYSAALLCRSCGNTERCRNCSISLTYHRDRNRLLCHYCGFTRSLPARCRDCGKRYIHLLGEGTEKVQEALQELFPEARVGRLDRDTVRRKGSLQRILSDFRRGRTDVLVGTQMIAKGHDFPGVTLVGVLSADQGLRLPDFRAAERTFQLLTQVAGRAGRGERAGRVVIQTYYPNHYSLKAARRQDYPLFFQEEIEFRRRFQYPPFSALVSLLVQGRDRGSTLDLAHRLGRSLLEHRKRIGAHQRLRILGPAPAPLERIKGEYRFQILIKAVRRPEALEVVRSSREELSRKGANLKQVSVDVDPVNLM
ncbi:MAG: primosomal protein N' [Acidobacteriota bacterium]|nr:primosomal protein N' [Acidobacteriota bacterium]